MRRVELIYDRDCPNVAQARAELLRAFAQAAIPAQWQEWERSMPESPAYVQQYGSPTVLVEGEDVIPMEGPAEGGCCRLYADDSGTRGAPPANEIARKLQRRGGGWRNSMAVLPGMGVALLPKLSCPACWPAYAGLVSAMGLGFLIEAKYLLGLTLAFLAIAVGALAAGARTRRGYGPLVLGMAASALLVAGKFAWDWTAMYWTGMGLLLAASLWNSWPRPAFSPSACPACSADPLKDIQLKETM